MNSPFTPDADKGVTQQTAGMNPDPPATRSASMDVDTSPLPADAATGCLITPYGGLGEPGGW